MNVRPSAIVWFSVLFVCTAIFGLLIPPAAGSLESLHITIGLYRFLVLTLLLPYGLIWFAAFYGYDQMQQYAQALRKTSEGKAFKKIADGLRVFAWGLMLTTLLSLVLTLIRDKLPAFTAGQAIINHYASLLIALVAFTLISDGTYRLAELVRAKRTKTSMRLLILLVAIIGVLFVRLVAINHTNNRNPYYLDIYPLLLTLVVPYLYAWTIGIIATTELRMYAQHVSGVLYRRSLTVLAAGLTIVIVVSIASQYITAAFTQNQGLSLGGLLVIIYLLLACEALGFALVALGAKRMKRIEEV